jgi:hypothetical protein
MIVQDHPNVEEYLARFLLSLRQETLLDDVETFEPTIRGTGLTEAEAELLR